MPLKNYGVLKGHPVDRRLATHANAHYQVYLVDETTDYRLAINVRSSLAPSEVEYLIEDDFQHPLTAGWEDLPPGFTHLASQPGRLALDYIRANLFDRTQMRPLPFAVPGLDNDLNEAIDMHIQRALIDEDAVIYAFGQRWGPEPGQKDKIFGFLPGNGIHDIHMNQGNVDRFVADDGVWQDGGLLIHFPRVEQWVAVFLKFQSQAWHTNDVTGHRLEIEDEPERDGLVRIVAALPNPVGPAPEHETVTLLNTSPAAIDLTGWAIADRNKHKHLLTGQLNAGATTVVTLPQDVQLGNKGGIITLLDSEGIKVDGVSYTREQGRREGWTVVF